MKKRCAVLFLSLLFICLCGHGLAQADVDVKRLDLAFGLFSVEVPADAVIGPNTGNALSSLRYEISIFPMPVYANFSPKAEYEDDAQRKMNSYISLLFALCGEGYTETEITEEKLPNGIDIRWQLMRGERGHALWFEAFSVAFGYNMCLFGEPNDEHDLRMLAMMRSFQSDPVRELDLLQLRQEKKEGGSFVSAEHGLLIQLDTDWYTVPNKSLQLPQTAYLLQKDDGEWFIQLLYSNPVAQEQTKDMLEWFVDNFRKAYPSSTYQVFGEPYSDLLDGLGGIEAWIIEEEISNSDTDAFVMNIAFVHESYGYYGSFMWIKRLDQVARPWMEDAMRSITVPAE